MKDQKEIIEELNGLVNILNDGKIGYKECISNVKSEKLKSHFLEFSNQRQEMASELKLIIDGLGGNSENQEGGILGVMHRTWMDVKKVFSTNDDEAILNAIATGEKVAVDKYEMVLKELTNQAAIHQVVNQQLTMIKTTLNDIEGLKLVYKD
jgi:uncharacterized protein (TIGR02284 family)